MSKKEVAEKGGSVQKFEKRPTAKSVEAFLERNAGHSVSVQDKGANIVRLWCNATKDEHHFIKSNEDVTPQA